MTAPNPYAAPQAASYAPYAQGRLDLAGHHYVPLGWRTVLASISVLGMTVVDAAMRLAQLAVGDTASAALRGAAPDYAAIAVLGAAGLGVLVLSVSSWVFVPVWFYRAAANLRGLGRYDLAFTPGGAAGWFFVPIANLWKPPQAMSEIWRASDPEGVEGSWVTSPRSSLVAVWWTGWLLAGFISWFSILARSDASVAAAIGLGSNAFRAIAAVALVLLMRGVSKRQEQAAGRPGA